MLASAFGSAVLIALEEWVKDDGKGDPLAILDRAIDSLGAEMRAREAAGRPS